MLDLKAKLAAAGLVTAADVAAVERKSTGPKGQDRKASRDHSPRSNSGTRSSTPRDAGPRGDRPSGSAGKPNLASKPGLDTVALKRAGKGEAYDAIRRAVDRSRLDAALAIPGEHAETFHFTTATGQLSRLMLEPDVRTKLAEGDAGIIAFMSHHGLAHSVVPRPLATAVAEVFPLWLRVLKDHPAAGQLEPPKPPPEPRPTVQTEPSAPGEPTPAELPVPADPAATG